VSTRYCDSLAARELLAMLRQAASAADGTAVRDAIATVTAALHGGAPEACVALQTFAWAGLPRFDAELYGAAISLGSALWHVEQGTDATAALDAAQSYLHAALDVHTAGAR
jgi:hypothetical protein